MPIFDTHAHYDDDAFNEDREELLASMAQGGVSKIVDVGSTYASLEKVMKLAREHDYIYAAIGLHPTELHDLPENTMEVLAELCKDPKVVAVGEIGLDYYWEKTEEDAARQKEWFLRQIAFAREIGKPIIIHSREAAKDTLDICQAEHVGDIGGVVHCYSYSAEMAKTYVGLGFYIGVGGVVTFKNARKLKETVEAIPLESIVLETDCPYLAPVPYRGDRNSSLYIPHVITEIAAIKGVSEEKVMRVTWENAHKLYRLPI